MATIFGYVTEAQIRRECWNVATDYYDLTALEGVGSRAESEVHNETQRPQSNPWLSTEDIYETVQNAVICYCKWLVGSGFDEWKEEADAARKEFIRLIGVIAAADTQTKTALKKRATTTKGPWLGNANLRGV